MNTGLLLQKCQLNVLMNIVEANLSLLCWIHSPTEGGMLHLDGKFPTKYLFSILLFKVTEKNLTTKNSDYLLHDLFGLTEENILSIIVFNIVSVNWNFQEVFCSALLRSQRIVSIRFKTGLWLDRCNTTIFFFAESFCCRLAAPFGTMVLFPNINYWVANLFYLNTFLCSDAL